MFTQQSLVLPASRKMPTHGLHSYLTLPLSRLPPVQSEKVIIRVVKKMNFAHLNRGHGDGHINYDVQTNRRHVWSRVDLVVTLRNSC
jgi:hypothetical protein